MIMDIPEALIKKLESEWNTEKNFPLSFNNISRGSHKKAWWICHEGHEWQAAIGNRFKGCGCPFCAGKKAIVGKNDLATTNPEIALLWHPSKNGKLRPEQFLIKSHAKVWWQCAKGHEWQTQIAAISQKGNCPFCISKRIIPGENDLSTVNPALAKEWDAAKNTGTNPCYIAPYSNKEYWWICRYGHEWKASPNHRMNGTDCPVCSKGVHTSFPEQALFYYISCSFSEVINNDKHLGMEFDIYIPSIDTYIEYDGMQWHKSQKTYNNDIKKNGLIDAIHARLIRIREIGCPELSPSQNVTIIPTEPLSTGIRSWKILTQTIDNLADLLNIKVDIDVARDYDTILQQQVKVLKKASLLFTNPELAAQWDYKKNGRLTPEMVNAGSGKYVWWLCEKGHSWHARIISRHTGVGCPYCSGRRPITGVNDLKTTHPSLVQEWHPTRNGNLHPQQVSHGSDKKVWWLCNKGHEWQAVISGRVAGHGCPYCSGRRPITGVNDLQSTHPQLAAEWHHLKNKSLLPSQVGPHSERLVWWQCNNGHQWKTKICYRTLGANCPYCTKSKKTKDFNQAFSDILKQPSV